MSQQGWIGQSLSGRYQIEELLGQGGMSAVYKATDPNLKRVVAIKMIHPHLSNDPEFIRRFEEEATAVAQLRHPNIVQVFDFNHDGDTYYMVLEFVPGETLQDHLKRLNASGRALPAIEAIEYAIHICEAIDYAHRRGMIHRDIKPANIMLSVMGQAILMDFGIAKMLGGQKHTATGAVLGTARYMPPEQIQGEHPDQRADIYSLGVTLFEMVSGHPPYEADSAMTLMMMHLHDPIPDLRQINPEVPEDLVAVIEKALAKDRDQRFQSAAEMSTALRRVQARLKGGVSLGATLIEPQAEQAARPGATLVEPAKPQAASTRELYQTQPPPIASGGGATFAEHAQALGAVANPGAAAAPKAGAPPRRKNLNPAIIAGGAIVLLALVCLAGAGIIFLPRLLNSGSGITTGGLPISPTSTTQAVALAATSVDTALPTATEAPTDTPAPPTATLPPTDTPLPSLTPTETVPPGIPYARIDSITIDDQNRYVVQYETFEFTEKLPGMHVHFFFNTVPPDQAGVPGKGPWILYGGPRPFTKYKVSDRPAAATQMCILVANPDHSVQPNSGNCMDLPQYP